MRSNCIVWAFLLHRRRHRKGREGYMLWRWSRWGRFPHALYCERRRTGSWRVVSYVPSNPRHKRLPPPLFSGRSKWGDL